MRFPSHATGPERGPGTAPEQMPAPRPYAHLGPEDGACLMETASVLAAEPFTDSPRGTDPALAALARAVNDAVGDRARRELAPLAAELATARPADRGFTARLIADVLRAARHVRRPEPAVRPAAHPATWAAAVREARCRTRARRLSGEPGGAWAAVRDAVWWRGPGRHHLEYALRMLLRAPDAQERLVGLLRTSVAAARQGAEEEARDAAGVTLNATASPEPARGTFSSATVG